MQAVLEPLVGRDGRDDAQLSGARQRRRGLFAERARELRRALQLRARRWVRAHGKSHREPGDRRVDARLEHGDPQRAAHERGGRGALPDRQEPHADEGGEERNRDAQGDRVEVAAVGDADDDEGDEVVDDDERQHEHPQARGPRGEQSQGPEGERGVARHRRPPAVGARAARIEEEVDRHRKRHPGQRGHHRRGHAAPLPQLPHRELPLGLEADDEEEEHHEAVVDPATEVLGDRRPAEVDRQVRGPHRLIRTRPRRVGPDQRGHGRPEEDGRAPGLGGQEIPHGCGEVPAPRRPTGERRGLRLGHGVVH